MAKEPLNNNHWTLFWFILGFVIATLILLGVFWFFLDTWNIITIEDAKIKEEYDTPFLKQVLTTRLWAEEGDSPIWESGYILEGYKSPQGGLTPITFSNNPLLSPFSGGVYEILMCESGGQHYNLDGTIKRGQAGEYGIAQFKWNTFYWMSEQANFNGSIYSAADQIYLLKWGIANDLCHHWTCCPY